MQPNTAGNPASAQPMRGLSQRAQKLLGPKRFGQIPVVPPKTNGDTAYWQRAMSWRR